MKKVEVHPYRDASGLKRQLGLSDEEIVARRFQPGGIWFPDTRIIMSGTFPPKREYHNRVGYIHYSSPRNQFWKHSEAVFGRELYINGRTAANSDARISNALSKESLAEEKKLGFVDIYTKVSRKHPDSAADTDLEPKETIFQSGLMRRLLDADVERFVFVYSLCRDEFISELERLGANPRMVIGYKTAHGLIELQKATLFGKDIEAVYCPIHGKNSWPDKQAALRLATDINALRQDRQ